MSIKIITEIIVLITLQATGVNSGGFVIDPGHSPKKQGATSCSGKPEYTFNAALSEIIFAKLTANNIPVTLTHKKNEELSLSERAELAKGKKLLLSVHHDSVQPQFITWKKNHPCSAKAEGYSIFISQKNHHYQQSLIYAQKLGTALIKRGYKPSLHHAEQIHGENRQLLDSKLGIYSYDDLAVLKNSDAPAILFEAGVIVNPDDENRITSEKFKMDIAEAVEDMIFSPTER